MNIKKNIFIAFILNLLFSLFEFIGGIFTNSISIISDSIHDILDALSIGISYFLEKKSSKKANSKYTYGYIRYSVLGSFITTTILIAGSIFIIYCSIKRLILPEKINYNCMIIFSIFGIILNFIAAFITKDGDSLNQKAVSLHMLEDVLGWVIVFIGSIVIKFTDISSLDSIMSIGVSIFIFIHAFKNLKTIIDIFLEKTPLNIDLDELKKSLLKIDGVIDVHHIHLRSIDGYNNYASMHIVTKEKNISDLKVKIRKDLNKFNIKHSVIETEDKICDCVDCDI